MLLLCLCAVLCVVIVVVVDVVFVVSLLFTSGFTCVSGEYIGDNRRLFTETFMTY